MISTADDFSVQWQSSAIIERIYRIGSGQGRTRSKNGHAHFGPEAFIAEGMGSSSSRKGVQRCRRCLAVRASAVGIDVRRPGSGADGGPGEGAAGGWRPSTGSAEPGAVGRRATGLVLRLACFPGQMVRPSGAAGWASPAERQVRSGGTRTARPRRPDVDFRESRPFSNWIAKRRWPLSTARKHQQAAG